MIWESITPPQQPAPDNWWLEHEISFWYFVLFSGTLFRSVKPDSPGKSQVFLVNTIIVVNFFFGMLVYRGVFCGHVSFIPLQGIWDVALRKGPTTSVYPASGGPRRRGLVQCLHFGILLPQILGELIRSDECFFSLTGWNHHCNYSQQIQTPQQIEWIDEWLVIFEQVHGPPFFPVEKIANIKQPLAAEWKRWDPLQKQFSFSFFRVGIFDYMFFCL